MSPEASTVSSQFPERPIRPLPKRRLRERLSPEVAESIEYPTASQTAAPLFYYPYPTKEDSGNNDASHGDRKNGLVTGAHEDASMRSASVNRSPAEALTRTVRTLPKTEQGKYANSQPPPSAASSVDGYDAFENTNNKKKRKIPSAGDSSLNGSLSEAAALSASATVNSTPYDIHGDSCSSPSSYGTGNLTSGSQGISGPGRGRFGRVRNGRSPLRALTDANNLWAGRTSKARSGSWASPSNVNSTGIISSAIANAEKLPASQGQENVSLLQQQPVVASKPNPASTQFTFTCESQVPGSAQWPGADPAAPRYPGKQSTMTTQANAAASAIGQAASDGSAAFNRPGGDVDTPSTRRTKGKGRLDRELRRAENERRRRAQHEVQTRPPGDDDFWMCEFCEYERIFGERPSALIRQYEMKELKQRKKEEERRRLIEKAKARGRKGKKNGKTAAKGGQNQAQALQGGQQTDHVENGQACDEAETGYDEEEFDDEGSPPDVEPPPALSDGGTAVPLQDPVPPDGSDGLRSGGSLTA